MKISLNDPIIQNLVIRGIERRLGELSRERQQLIELWKKYNRQLDLRIVKPKQVKKRRKMSDTQRINMSIRMKEYWAKKRASNA